MSGIFGIIHFDGRPVDPARLDRMREAMAHRGPDGNDFWLDGCAGLGQLMLCSTPESLDERLPWRDPECGLVIVADARIDNRNELIKLLGADLASWEPALWEPALPAISGNRNADDRRQGRLPQQGRPDSQLIVAAYKRWGEACVNHLLGDFAFAIWDPIEQKLFCARDRMGSAPFSYVARDHYFAFASEPEALLHLPGVSRQPNENLIAHILVPAFENMGDDRSWHRDVLALIPAHLLTVTSGRRVRKRCYWSLDSTDETSYSSVQECREHFAEIFAEAVRCRLRAPGSVAVMLSGGLDSAGIAAMVKRLSVENPGKNIHSYSAIEDDPESSVESRSILSMAHSLEMIPHFLSMPSFAGMVSSDDVIRAAWAQAHPVDNMLLLPAMMCLGASRDGNRVMLEGASGDVTMRLPGPYASVFLRQGRFLKAWNECVAASRNNVYLRGTSPLTLLKQNLWHAFAPEGIRRRRKRIQRGDLSSAIEASLIQAEFARQLRLPERLEEQYELDVAASLANPDSPQARQYQPFLLWGLAGYDRVAAHYGVQVRDPWADPRVVGFFMRLPIEYMVQNGWTKYLARVSFEQELAPDVLWRRDKEHLGWRLIKYVMDESRPLIAGLMSEEIAALEGFVDLDAARTVYDRWTRKGDNASRLAVFELVTLMLWIKRVNSL